MRSWMTKRAGSVVIVALFVLGLVGLDAEGSLITNASFEGWTRVTDNSLQDGEGDVVWTTNPSVGDDTLNRMQRMVNVFELPELAAGQYVSAASFTMVTRIFYDNDPDDENTVPALQFAFYEKGSSSAVTTSDYQTAAAKTYNAITMPAGGSSAYLGATQTWSNADLVTAISNAYVNGSDYVAVRFQLAETAGGFYHSINGYAISDGDELVDFYGVHYDDAYTGTDYGNPALQLTVIPEPGSLSMIAVFAAGAVFLRRRSRRA
jgi:hypothetical protein